jgi:hypothetical protein
LTTSDALRDELAAMGVEVRDTPVGQETTVRRWISVGIRGDLRWLFGQVDGSACDWSRRCGRGRSAA